MIGRQQDASIGKHVFGAVVEFVLALARNQLSSLQIVEIGVESDSSQGDDDPQILEPFQFAFEKRSALGQFLGQRFVIRRRATGRGGDVETRERLAIVAGGSP